jgi:hypothetical protein
LKGRAQSIESVGPRKALKRRIQLLLACQQHRALGIELREPGIGLHPNRIKVGAKAGELSRREPRHNGAYQLLTGRESGRHRASSENRVEKIADSVGRTTDDSGRVACDAGQSAGKPGCRPEEDLKRIGQPRATGLLATRGSTSGA